MAREYYYLDDEALDEALQMEELDPIIHLDAPRVFADEELHKSVAEFASVIFAHWQSWRRYLRENNYTDYKQEEDIAFIKQLEVMIFG